MISNINNNNKNNYNYHLSSFTHKSMQIMPKQLWLYLFSFLNKPNDMINVSASCKTWLYISQEPQFLKIFTQKLFPSKHLIDSIKEYKIFLSTQKHLINKTNTKNKKLIGTQLKTRQQDMQNILVDFDLWKEQKFPSNEVWKKEDVLGLFSNLQKKWNIVHSNVKNVKTSGFVIFIKIDYIREIPMPSNVSFNIKNNLLLLVDKHNQSVITTIYKEFPTIKNYSFTEDGKVYVTFENKNEETFFLYDVYAQKHKCNIF